MNSKLDAISQKIIIKICKFHILLVYNEAKFQPNHVCFHILINTPASNCRGSVFSTLSSETRAYQFTQIVINYAEDVGVGLHFSSPLPGLYII